MPQKRKMRRKNNMKKMFGKLISAALSAISAVSVMTAVPAFADDLPSPDNEPLDGAFTYEVVDGTYTIVSCDAVIVTSIPASRNGIAVTAIGDGAFANCSAVTSLELPTSIRSIGDNAFYNCTALKELTLPKNLQHIGAHAFMGCSALESIEIPASITEVPDFAFSMCDQLKSVTLPDTLTSIGQCAFYACASIEEFKLPASLKTIGDYAMQEWYSITDIDTSGNSSFIVEDGMLMNKAKTSVYRGLVDITGDVYIPDTVTTVKGGAFSGCMKIVNLFLPESLTVIGGDGFSYCASLRTVNFSQGLSVIENTAFFNDTALAAISLPSTLTSIGDLAFSCCSSLERAILPEGIKTIGNGAFLACDKLTRVSVPKSIETVGDQAFGVTAEGDERKKLDGFEMSVFSGSAAHKYAKKNDIPFTVVDHSLKKMAFLVIAIGLILAAIVFAVVLMTRGKKSPDHSVKKAQKEAEQKAEEDAYESIIDKD